MKHILLPVLLLAAVCDCRAQDETSSKWEIGVDLLSAFDAGKNLHEFTHIELLHPSQTASDLPFLKHVVLTKRRLSEKTKLRAGMGFTFEERHNRPNSFPETDLLSGGPFGVYLSAGIERYGRVGKVEVFWGAEAFGSFYRSLDEADTKAIAPYMTRTIYDYYSDQKYGINGLFGVNVRLVSHLYLSVESSLQMAFRRQYNDFEEHRDGALYSSGGRTLKRYIASFQPVSAILLIYQF